MTMVKEKTKNDNKKIIVRNNSAPRGNYI